MTSGQQLRQRGNALYRRGQLTDAIKAYQEAARRAGPDDYLPWSNLSAAYYEGGNLADSIQSALRALAICQRHDQANGTNTSAVAEQKLVPRMIRAYLHSHNFDAARQWLDLLRASGSFTDENEICHYQDSLENAELLWRAMPDADVCRSHLLAELPRHRPSLSGSQRPFVNTTLNEVTDLVDFVVHSNIDRDLSIFLGGIGDARHFYAQLAMLGVTERMVVHSTSHFKRKYHFVLNDNNGAAIGRTLVLAVLLDDLACLTDLPQAERTEIYTVVYYIFAGVIIPHYASGRLFRTVDSILDRLRHNESPLPWLQVYDSDRLELIRTLETWKNWHVINLCPTSEVIDKTVQGVYVATTSYRSLYGNDASPRAPSGCRKEFETYFEAPFLQAPRSVMREHEPELLRLLEVDAPPEKLLNHVTESWCVNPTLVDGEDWYMRQSNAFDAALSGNPFDVCRTLYNVVSVQERGGPRKTKLFDYASSFFQMVVVALRRIRGRLSAECILGNATDAVDWICYGLIDHRNAAAPTVFDLVHLSNAYESSIPMIISASNILNDAQTTRLLFSAGHVDSVPDQETLFKTTQMQVARKKGEYAATPTSSTRCVEVRRDRLAAFPYEQLLSRAELSRFMFTQFFNLAAPYGTNISSGNSSYKAIPAFNLTNFFSLFIHLHDIGYPAHWLADVLAKLLGGGVNASPSPPRTPDEANPRGVSVPALKHGYESSVAPFIPELSTLTTMFQRVLPFNAIATGLPPATSIYQYTITFNKLLPSPKATDTPLLLAIYNAHVYIPGATSMSSPFPEEGCIIITAFTCTQPADSSYTASVNFWLREDVMHDIQTQPAPPWYATLLRVSDSGVDEAGSEVESETNNPGSVCVDYKWIPCCEDPVRMDCAAAVEKRRQWMSSVGASSNSPNRCDDGTMELDA